MIQDKVFYLLDIDETPLRALPLSAEYKLEDFQDSTNRIEVRLPHRESGAIMTDQEIVFRGRRFSIFEAGLDKETGEIVLLCDEIQARLTDINLPTFNLKDDTLPEAMKKALARAAAIGWSVGDVFETNLNYNAELKNVSTLFALRFLERQSGGRLFFDSGKRKVHMRETGQLADVLFRYGKNVANIEKTQTSPQATVLFAYGRDGMTIEALTGGQKYVEDFSWYLDLGMTLKDARKKYTKELVWEDDRYIYNANLYRDAVTRLGLLSQPQINYKLTNANADGVELGMRAYVADEELGIRVLVAVTKLIRSSTPGEDELELDYIRPSLGATLDNEYSGDTNTGQSGETSFFLQKNQSAFTVSNVPAPIITSDITVFSATAFEMGVTLMIEVTGGGLFEGYFTMQGERLPVEIKQTVAPGWYTFGLPFIVSGVQEGTKTLRFYLMMETGAATVPKERAEFYIKASGVYGGDSNEKPDQKIIDEVEMLNVEEIRAADQVVFNIDEPRRFGPVEYVELKPVEKIAVSDFQNVILDPPPVGTPPPPPLSDTQIRSEFANMEIYKQPTRPTQEQAAAFIDTIHAEAARFMIWANEQTVYIIASYGSFIDINETPGGPVITSDDPLYTTFGSNNTFMGIEIDWSDRLDGLELVERYSVPEDTAPEEAGPPRRIQTVTGYTMTDTEIAPAPETDGRISSTPVEVGAVYRISRTAISDLFIAGFSSSSPAFDGSAEPIVIGSAEQDPAALEIEIETPPGSTHLLIYQSGNALEGITIRKMEPLEEVDPNLFSGEYITNYFPNQVGVNYTTNAGGISALIPVVAGVTYKMERLVKTDRWRIAYLNREPTFNGQNDPSSILSADTELMDTTSTLIFERTMPTDTVYLYLYLSTSGETPGLIVKEI